jgi:imidazolonepropionase-like amidohydrolase
MYAVRARRVFDGERFLEGGATVLVDGSTIAGVEPFGHEVPHDCDVTTYDGTVLPGLIDVHVHLFTDSGPQALDRVAGYTDEEIDEVVTAALARSLAAGVTTVRDLGDRRYNVVARRDAQRRDDVREPRILASGPPVTIPDGHLHYCGGEVSGAEAIRAAVAERVEHGVDVVKVMASGGMATMNTDVTLPQFSREDLQLLVDEAHAAGLPVTAHAHAASAIDLAVAVGVDGIEHATYLVRMGDGAESQATDEQLEALAAHGAPVCPTLGGLTVENFRSAPPAVQERLRQFGQTPELIVEQRLALLSRMLEAGVRLVSGTDAGILPTKAHGRNAEAVVELAPVTGNATALATATSVAAEVCGLEACAGRLRPGFDADLLAVRGDVEQDVRALRDVEQVVLRGERTVAG